MPSTALQAEIVHKNKMSLLSRLISGHCVRETPLLDYQTCALQLVSCGWVEMLIIYFHFFHWKSAAHTLMRVIYVPHWTLNGKRWSPTAKAWGQFTSTKLILIVTPSWDPSVGPEWVIAAYPHSAVCKVSWLWKAARREGWGHSLVMQWNLVSHNVAILGTPGNQQQQRGWPGRQL